MAKEIIYGEGARKALMNGINQFPFPATPAETR